MSTVRQMVRRFCKEERAATMVEYALMVALIAVVVIIGAGYLGGTINNTFNEVGGNVAGASGP